MQVGEFLGLCTPPTGGVCLVGKHRAACAAVQSSEICLTAPGFTHLQQCSPPGLHDRIHCYKRYSLKGRAGEGARAAAKCR